MSTPLLSFDTAHAAVLSMDLQTAIVSIYAKGDSDLITRAANVLREARSALARARAKGGKPDVERAALMYSGPHCCGSFSRSL